MPLRGLMNLSLNSQSSEDTFEIGKKLGEFLKGRELILLSGELGAGKTVLTKGIGFSLGIDPNEIVSPTFTLMNIYKGRTTLYHLDLYRIGNNITGSIPEIDESIGSGVLVVEWAKYLDPFYLNEKNLVEIKILHPGINNESREILIRSKSSQFERFDIKI